MKRTARAAEIYALIYLPVVLLSFLICQLIWPWSWTG